MDLFNLDPQIAFVEGQLWNITRLVGPELVVAFKKNYYGKAH